MSLPNPNPSLLTAVNPYFQDNDFVRGVQMRNNNVSIWGNLDVLSPTGIIGQFAQAAAPAGWLACDGSPVSRATYAALFTTIGILYGPGDGSTTFNLPDVRGLVIVGAGANGTLTRGGGGAFDGGAVGASRNDMMQSHLMDGNTDQFFAAAGGLGSFAYNWAGGGSGTLLGNNVQGAALVANGQGTPRHGEETRPAEIAFLVCIKF